MPQRLTMTTKGLRSSPLLLSNGGEHSPLCSLQRLGIRSEHFLDAAGSPSQVPLSWASQKGPSEEMLQYSCLVPSLTTSAMLFIHAHVPQGSQHKQSERHRQRAVLQAAGAQSRKPAVRGPLSLPSSPHSLQPTSSGLLSTWPSGPVIPISNIRACS